MSDTDQGDQEILFDYETELDAEDVSKRLRNIVPTGIYDGFQTSQKTSVKVELLPGVMEISSSSGHQVRIKTNSSVIVEPTESSPFVVARWSQKNQGDWYASFTKAVSIQTHDIVFAKALFDNNGDINGLDKTDRSYPEFNNAVSVNGQFRTYGGRNLSQTLVETDSHTVGKKDHSIEVNTNKASSPTITLPEIVEQGREIIVSDIVGNASSENITIEVNDTSEEDINGSNTVTISSDWGSITLVSSLSQNRWIITSNE